MQNLIVENLSQYGMAGICVLFLAIVGKTLYEDGKKREDYIIEKNEEREARYQDVIAQNQEVILNLTKSLEVVEVMKRDVDDLKTVKTDVKELKEIVMRKI